MRLPHKPGVSQPGPGTAPGPRSSIGRKLFRDPRFQICAACAVVSAGLIVYNQVKESAYFHTTPKVATVNPQADGLTVGSLNPQTNPVGNPPAVATNAPQPNVAATARAAVPVPQRTAQAPPPENLPGGTVGGVLGGLREPGVNPPPAPANPGVANCGGPGASTARFDLAATLRGQTSAVNALAFTADSRSVAAGSADESVRFWDVATGQAIHTLPSRGETGKEEFSPDLRKVVYAAGKSVTVVDTQTGLSGPSFQGTANQLFDSPALTRDGRWLAVGDLDGAVTLWNLQSTNPPRILDAGGKEWVFSVRFSPDGRRLAATDGADVRLWEVPSGRELNTFNGSTRLTGSVAFSPNGRRLAGGGMGTIDIWETQTGQKVLSLSGHDPAGSIQALAFSPDSRWLASGSEDGTAKIWDLRSGQTLQTLPGAGGFVPSIAYSPDGCYVASGSVTGTVLLWRRGG